MLLLWERRKFLHKNGFPPSPLPPSTGFRDIPHPSVDSDQSTQMESARGACIVLRDEESECMMPSSSIGLQLSNSALDFPVYGASILYEVKKRWFADIPRSAAVR